MLRVNDNKKSKSGIRTLREDVKLIAERLKRAQEDYKSRGRPGGLRVKEES